MKGNENLKVTALMEKKWSISWSLIKQKTLLFFLDNLLISEKTVGVLDTTQENVHR